MILSAEEKNQNEIRLKKKKKNLNTKSVSLVFSSYYMDAPASMFGHTLLKLNNKDYEDSDLLNYGINFTADANPEDPFYLYALKGLLGGYSGKYSIFPYYTKVIEYNHWESRNIWEYELNLTEEELERLLKILWNSGSNKQGYYFLDKNCGYGLATVLDEARGNQEIQKNLRWPISPSDLVKSINSIPGFVKRKRFRASDLNLLMQRISELPDGEKAELESVWKQWKSNSEKNNHTDVSLEKLSTSTLDTLVSLQSYELLKARKDPLKSDSFQYLLIQRSLRTTANLSPKEPLKESLSELENGPEKGHGSYRILSEVGNSSLGTFASVEGRLAFHDLMNLEKGYAKNAEVQFLNLGLRRYLEAEKWEMNHFQILKVTSIAPYNYITKSKSYLLDLGFESISFETQSKKDIRTIASKVEGAWGITLDGSQFGSKLVPQLSLLGGMKANQTNLLNNGGRAGLSGNFLALWDLGAWKYQAQFSYYEFSISENSNDYKVDSTLRYAITDNLEVRIRYAKTRFFEESGLAFHFLF